MKTGLDSKWHLEALLHWLTYIQHENVQRLLREVEQVTAFTPHRPAFATTQADQL